MTIRSSFAAAALAVATVSLPTTPAEACATGACGSDLRIAVVGGGAAGLMAARTLRQRGYDHVTVFEKEATPGGKIDSFAYGPHTYELGAMLMDGSYTLTEDLAREFGVPWIAADDPHVLDPQGNSTAYPELVKETWGTARFAANLARFGATIARYPGITKPGFAGLDPDLYQPMSAFAAQHHIEPVADTFQSFMTGCGYGYYDEVPALYILKLLPWLAEDSVKQKLHVGAPLLRRFPGGWQSVWTAVASQLDVRTNAEVTKLVRYQTEDGPKVVLESTDNGNRDKVFDRVVVAAPLETAGRFLDASAEERRLFSRVKTYRYLVTLAEADGLASGTVHDNVTRDSLGHVNIVMQSFPDSKVYVFYQLLDESTSQADALAILDGDVRAMGGRLGKVVTRKEWRYFPHVTTADLQDHFYERMDALQGARGTYYVGSVFNFEIVEQVARYSKFLVEREFPRIR